MTKIMVMNETPKYAVSCNWHCTQLSDANTALTFQLGLNVRMRTKVWTNFLL